MFWVFVLSILGFTVFQYKFVKNLSLGINWTSVGFRTWLWEDIKKIWLSSIKYWEYNLYYLYFLVRVGAFIPQNFTKHRKSRSREQTAAFKYEFSKQKIFDFSKIPEPFSLQSSMCFF